MHALCPRGAGGERCPIRIDTAGVDAKTGAVDDAAARAALPKACPELGLLPELDETPELRGKAEKDGDVTYWNLASCTPGERLFDCKHRYRSALAVAVNTAILVRTKEEQQAWLVELQRTPEERKKWLPDPAGGIDAVKAQSMLEDLIDLCRVDDKKLDKPLTDLIDAADMIRPCGERNGVLEDYFRFLEHGLVKGAGVALTATQRHEPGCRGTLSAPPPTTRWRSIQQRWRGICAPDAW